ncbi:MAG TPA: pitrilysin family protein, partial [Candidatus Eisenbacteria bacterium]|nr:pitrilysin family protein [Candidatus Eisenbacteria bacterium]
MSLRRLLTTAVIVLGLASAIAPADVQARAAAPRKSAPAVAKAEKLASVEGITEYKLSNGMRILLFPDPSKQTATVNITYLVGSRHEGYGETGMAHLLEHLLFKGSKNHRDIYQELTAHGSRPNGTTWFDRTNYFETFGATEENLAWALDLEADRMVNSFIAKKDLDSEMTVVRNEFEIDENDSRAILTERVFSTAYLWHNYGKSTIGARSDIEGVPIERLQAFYRKWYQPDNAILVVAGNFDEAKTLRMIEKKFGVLPRSKQPIDRTYTVEPVQDGERTVTLRRVGDTKVASAGYHIPAGSDPDYAAVSVLGFILGDQPSGRLYKALVETKKAATISIDVSQFRDPGLLYVDATTTSDGAIEDVRDTMIRTLENFNATPPTEQDVARARDNLLKGWDLMIRDSQRAALNLSEWAAMGDWRLMFIHRDRLQKVTVGDVTRVAGAYLKSSNRTAGLFYPTKEPDRATIPPLQDIAAVVKDYKGGEALSAGEAFDPSPDAVEARVTRTTLPSGLKLSFLPKKTRGSTVQALIRLHFGSESDLRGRKRIAEMTGSMLTRGTAKHTRQEWKDEVDRLKATVRVDGATAGTWATIDATRETLPQALRLAVEAMREPVFPATELELLRQEVIAAVEESKTDPRQLASTAASRHISPRQPDDPRYIATPDEILETTKKVTAADVKQFHADFYGASDGEVSIVGDFDPKAVQDLLNELLGSWKSPRPYVRMTTPYEDRPALVKSIEAPDKTSAFMQAVLRVQMKDSDADYPAMILGNFMTGGGFINSRLATRIRRVEGLSYGVGSGFIATPWEDDARFFAIA